MKCDIKHSYAFTSNKCTSLIEDIFYVLAIPNSNLC